MESLKIESRTRYTMLEVKVPRPMHAKTLRTSLARLPRGVLSAASVEDIG
jgi:hypothetical protein